MLRTFLLTLVIAFPVVGNAANKEPAATKQSRAKDWPGPDVSIKLQNQGKQTAAGKALAECEGTARSLFVQKKYQDALRQYQQCVDLDPKDFQAQFGVGSTLYNLQRYEEGANALRKAQELRPENFEVNFWKGMCLARQRKFNEAIPDFEKAHQIKPDDVAARIELFGCYLATQQSQKAFRIFPIIVRVVGGGLMIAYFFGLAVLLVFSLPMRAAAFPGFWFSIAWLALFVEGQVALWLLLALLPWLSGSESALAAVALAGVPIFIVAATGFARQPWGQPFRWPLRFGPAKVAIVSLSLLLMTILMGAAFSQIYVQLTHKPFPLQHTIPLIRGALHANPVIAWLAVALVIPVVEEIVFRGLFFGMFEKYWGVKGAILGSTFVFVCVHLQIVGFFYLFCLGLILGWARWRAGSLGLPIFLHCLNNSLAMIVLTLNPQS